MIKRSCENIIKKNIRNTKVVYLHKETLFFCSILLFTLREHHIFCCIFDESERKCFAILNRKNHSMEKFILPTKRLSIRLNLCLKKTCASKTFLWLCLGLHATAVDCAHELIMGSLEQKERLAKFSKINKQGVLNKVGEGGKKQDN